MIENSKIALLAVSMIAVGVLVLPQTVSLFAGQHYWYNISSSENDIPCEKCHADVKEELDMSNFHKNFSDSGQGSADRKDCEACHRINGSITYASDSGTVKPGEQAHAASIVSCMLCHQHNASQAMDDGSYAGYYAGGFNVTDMGVSSGFNYSNGTHSGHLAAHNAFVAKAINNETLKDSNEACIACHTFMPVKINFSHRRSLEFKVDLEADVTTDHGPHNWNITEWSTNGTAYATVYGDTYGTNGSTSYNSSVWPGTVPGVNYTYND